MKKFYSYIMQHTAFTCFVHELHEVRCQGDSFLHHHCQYHAETKHNIKHTCMHALKISTFTKNFFIGQTFRGEIITPWVFYRKLQCLNGELITETINNVCVLFAKTDHKLRGPTTLLCKLYSLINAQIHSIYTSDLVTPT